MSRPVNHRERIEGWLRDALAIRGAEVGYVVLGSKVNVQDGSQMIGWTVLVTMRHPLIGQGDLFVPVSIPVLTVDQSFIVGIVPEALKQLDAKRAEIEREAMQPIPGPAR